MAEWISTHVLDTTSGDPARGVPVRLQWRADDGWQPLAEGLTDSDGRVRFSAERRDGGYQLIFDVASHLGVDAFFTEVTVAFQVRDTDRSYHVPLLLSRYGYTTYRGS